MTTQVTTPFSAQIATESSFFARFAADLLQFAAHLTMSLTDSSVSAHQPLTVRLMRIHIDIGYKILLI